MSNALLQTILQAKLDASQCARDLPGNDGFAVLGGFAIEDYAVPAYLHPRLRPRRRPRRRLMSKG
jgi:hypothetical protein